MPIFYQTGWEAMRQARAHFAQLPSEDERSIAPASMKTNGVVREEHPTKESTANISSDSSDSNPDEPDSDDDIHVPALAQTIPNGAPAVPSEPAKIESATTALTEPDVNAVEDPDPIDAIACAVCQTAVRMPCWSCTQCIGTTSVIFVQV